MGKKKLSSVDRLKRSQSAHVSLQRRAQKRNNEQLNIYHGACINQQKKHGRVLTRSEREAIYDNVAQTLKGPVISNKNSDFERDYRGRIKGSYTVDGFFEPD